jgi:hypothetical protein
VSNLRLRPPTRLSPPTRQADHQRQEVQSTHKTKSGNGRASQHAAPLLRANAPLSRRFQTFW